MFSVDWRSPATKPRQLSASPGNIFGAIRITVAIIARSRAHQPWTSTSSKNASADGDSAFLAEPTITARDQPVFWSPLVLPTVIPLTRAWDDRRSALRNFSFPDFPSADIRRVSGGWYVFLRIRGIEHRLLLQEPPITGATYAATLAFDDFFESRTHSARRLWRALSGRPLGPDFRKLPAQRRDRLVDALRALDARLAGATYRAIAEALFGAERTPARGWKTHDLRNRTIRLIQSGRALMRDGYFDLLRYPLRRN